MFRHRVLIPQPKIDTFINTFFVRHSYVFLSFSLTFACKNEILAPQYSNVLQAVLSTFLCGVTIAFLGGTHILLVDVSV
jgi:hypothetical protein